MRTLRFVVTAVLISVIGELTFVALSPDYGMFVVQGESMRPTFGLGDLVVTGPAHGFLSNGVQQGTVVSFQSGDAVVTHRVISIQGDSLVTKGDAVEDPDPKQVQMSEVVGVFLFKIPRLGYLSQFIHTRAGWFVGIILPAALLVGLIVREIGRESMASAKPQAKEEEDVLLTQSAVDSRSQSICSPDKGATR